MRQGKEVTMKGPRRFVESLLRGRRPRRFPVDDTDADILRAAIELRAARPGSGTPNEEFVVGLYQRLARERREEAERRPVATRRQIVLGGALAATGVAVGVAIDQTLAGPGAPAGGGTLIPDAGVWHPVVAAAELPEGAVRAFDAGSVNGFVYRSGGRLRAISGTCTHQGCRLGLEAGMRLRCPCHRALFALDGRVLHHRFPGPLPALPRIAVRQADGVVQVYIAA
jgi:nitrite reductase/ring-hydroxylating ferredoxin subunit